MKIMTVRGPVDSDSLGLTLTHEHLIISALIEYRGDGFTMDEDVACTELALFASAGGGTLVDLTTVEIGRDPLALRRISERTGVNVIMGAGHYRDPYLDKSWFDRTSVSEIADDIIRDATIGVGETGVRCGVIGEIGTDLKYISAVEERSLRAAARAHLETNLTISTHAARWPVGTLQLDLMEEEHVPLDRVIVGHVDTVPNPGYALELARRGCWVEFDGFGTDHQAEGDRAIRTIRNLADAGFFDQVLISQDVFLRSHLHTYGGSGYDYLPLELPALLRTAGFTDEEFTELTVEHPRRALSGEKN